MVLSEFRNTDHELFTFLSGAPSPEYFCCRFFKVSSSSSKTTPVVSALAPNLFFLSSILAWSSAERRTSVVGVFPLAPNFSARFCLSIFSQSLSTKDPPNFSALFLSQSVLQFLTPPYFFSLSSRILAAYSRFPPGPDSLNFSFLSSSLSRSERVMLGFFSTGFYEARFDYFDQGLGGSLAGWETVLGAGGSGAFGASTGFDFAAGYFALVQTGAGFQGSLAGVSFLAGYQAGFFSVAAGYSLAQAACFAACLIFFGAILFLNYKIINKSYALNWKHHQQNQDGSYSTFFSGFQSVSYSGF